MTAKEKMSALAKQLANAMIEHDSDEWPPDCIIFTYQPVRPTSSDNSTAVNDESDE